MAARTVAFLIQGNEGYGTRRMALTLSGALRKRGWRTPFIALEDGSLASASNLAGVDVHVLNLGRIPTLDGGLIRKAQLFGAQCLYVRRAVQPITAKLREIQADALHFIWPSLVGLGGAAASETGIPAFWEMPNDVGPGYPFGINRRIYQRLCRKHGVTPLAISRHTASTLGNGPVTAVLCYLSCDAERFNPSSVVPITRSELTIPEEAIVFTVCARLVEDKGQLRFLRALLDVGDHSPPLHLLLLGGPIDGAYPEWLLRIAGEAGAANRLHMPGPVDDPERYYTVTDVAVNSRIMPEPFGLGVIEAMMMERPVLVHALGGPAETVVDGVTGWHVHDPTPTGFLAGIRRALADRPRWPEMRTAARRHALANFASTIHAQRYMHIVEHRIRG